MHPKSVTLHVFTGILILLLAAWMTACSTATPIPPTETPVPPLSLIHI